MALFIMHTSEQSRLRSRWSKVDPESSKLGCCTKSRCLSNVGQIMLSSSEDTVYTLKEFFYAWSIWAVERSMLAWEQTMRSSGTIGEMIAATWPKTIANTIVLALGKPDHSLLSHESIEHKIWRLLKITVKVFGDSTLCSHMMNICWSFILHDRPVICLLTSVTSACPWLKCIKVTNLGGH